MIKALGICELRCNVLNENVSLIFYVVIPELKVF